MTADSTAGSAAVCKVRSETEMAREIQLTDWSTAGNLSNRSSGVQILRDICTRFGRYLYSTEVQLDNKISFGVMEVLDSKGIINTRKMYYVPCTFQRVLCLA